MKKLILLLLLSFSINSFGHMCCGSCIEGCMVWCFSYSDWDCDEKARGVGIRLWPNGYLSIGIWDQYLPNLNTQSYGDGCVTSPCLD